MGTGLGRGVRRGAGLMLLGGDMWPNLELAAFARVGVRGSGMWDVGVLEWVGVGCLAGHGSIKKGEYI